MDIEAALAPPDGSLADAAVAVVGAGGKKTTMYALAARLDRAVVTASVRIPIFDPHVARVAVTEEPTAALGDAAPEDFPLGLVPAQEREDRYLGYDAAVVDELVAAHDGPVLIKADGARMREFKAPKEGEPQIPAATDVAVPIASAHAVGEPLTDELVHRPGRVAAVARRAGLEVGVGDEITPAVVGAVLASEAGGLKGVPPDATSIPLINKVDDAGDEAVAREVAAAVHERADVPKVVFAAMAEPRVVDVV